MIFFVCAGDIKNNSSVDIVLDHTLDIDFNPVSNSAKSKISNDYFRTDVDQVDVTYYESSVDTFDTVYLPVSTVPYHSRGLYSAHLASAHYASVGVTYCEYPVYIGVQSAVTNTALCVFITFGQSSSIHDHDLGKSTDMQYIKGLLGPPYIRVQPQFKYYNSKTSTVGALYFLHHSRSCASDSPSSVQFSLLYSYARNSFPSVKAGNN